MTLPEPTQEALNLFRAAVIAASDGLQFKLYEGKPGARVIDQALQVERDKERDAVVAWLREREGAWRLIINEHRGIGAPHVPRALADALEVNQHRSAEHV